MSKEPKPVAWESTYASFRNNPIYFADPNGDWPKIGKFLRKLSPWHLGGGRKGKMPFNWKNSILSKINLNINWKGLGNMFRDLDLGPPAGRMVNQGWSEFQSGSLATTGDPIDRTTGINLYKGMAGKAGDSRVTMTGFEMRGTAPAGTSVRVTGGLSQAHQRTLFASNGLQNMAIPSHLRLLLSDDEGRSPIPDNYFELRAGIIPGTNLIPTFSLLNPSAGSRIGLAAWMGNAFNHKPAITNKVWSLRIRVMGLHHGRVNYKFRYRWKAWTSYKDLPRSALTGFWHKLMWGY